MLHEVGIIRDERYLEHKTGLIHPEHPNRLKYIYKMLDNDFSDAFLEIEPKPVTLSDLELVHTPSYIKKVLQTAGRDFTHLAVDTTSSTKSYLAAWLAAGGCIEGLETLLAGKCKSCFALVRPPGHHALPDRAGGFCIFNNLGIAARYGLLKHSLQRILVIDWDVHHGNALQSLFYREKEVLYFSTHRDSIFPHTGAWEEAGEGDGLGYNINIILPNGLKDGELFHIYDDVVGSIMREYRPELVLVAAGFDLHGEDSFSRSEITAGIYGALTHAICAHATEVGDPPLLFALEGGYRIPALTASVKEVLKALMSREHDGFGSGLKPGRASRLIAAARKVHSRYGVWTG